MLVRARCFQQRPFCLFISRSVGWFVGGLVGGIWRVDWWIGRLGLLVGGLGVGWLAAVRADGVVGCKD